MQEILDTMNGYSLRLSLPFLPPPSQPRPSPKKACSFLLHRYCKPSAAQETTTSADGKGAQRGGTTHQHPPAKAPPSTPILSLCAERIASFIVSSELLVVSSASHVATVRLQINDTVVQQTCAAPNEGAGGEYSGVATSPASSTSKTTEEGSIYMAYSLGVAQYSPRLRLLDDFDGAGHSDAALCIDATLDGRHLATGGRDAAVIYWSCEDGPLKYMVGHTDWVRFVKFHQFGVLQRQLLLSAGDDGAVVVWAPSTGERLTSTNFQGNGRAIRCFDVAQCSSSIVATAFDASSIHLMELRDDCVVPAAARGPAAAAPSMRPPLGKQGLSSFTLEEAGTIDNPHRGTLTSLRFNTTGAWLVSAGEDETIAVSCVRDRCVLWRSTSLVSKRRCITFMNTIASIAIVACPPSSSTMMVCACSSDGDVLFWVIDPRDGRSSYERKIQLQIGPLVGVDIIR